MSAHARRKMRRATNAAAAEFKRLDAELAAALEDARRVRQDLGVLEAQRAIEQNRVAELEHGLAVMTAERDELAVFTERQHQEWMELRCRLTRSDARVNELEALDREPAKLRRRLRDKTAELAEAHREIRRLKGEQAEAEPLIIDPGPASALAVLAAARAGSRGRR